LAVDNAKLPNKASDLDKILGFFKYDYKSVRNFVVVYEGCIGIGEHREGEIFFDFEESPIAIEKVDFIEARQTLILQSVVGLMVYPLTPTNLLPFQDAGFAIKELYPETIITIKDRFLAILTEGEFYVLDLDFNPNVPNDKLQIDEIIRLRQEGKKDFLFENPKP
jgi:hypothetical protein